MHTRVDAAVAADAENAPTATWKTARGAVSHSAHTHHRLVGEARPQIRIYGVNPASHTKFLTLPRSMSAFLNRLVAPTTTSRSHGPWHRFAPTCGSANSHQPATVRTRTNPRSAIRTNP